MPFLHYSPSIEQLRDDEAATFAKIADTFIKMGETVRDQESHAVRVSHAKSTGLLKGELIVDDGLLPELAQGICASPGRYDALIRLAQGPGEILNDRISTHRGMAIKVLGVSGERIPESTEAHSQDWVLEAGKTAFINSNASKFLLNLKAGVSNAPIVPGALKAAVSTVSRAINAPLEAIGAGSKTLAFFGHPPLHPLSESYFSQVPIRWGDYVAKIGVYPSAGLIESINQEHVQSDEFNAFRQAVIAHFSNKGAEFELRVQLATDSDETPIEDASKEWPESESPYRRVARIVLPAQTAWTPQRSAIFDERLSFRPANSLVAHRPLGEIMRARLFVYKRLVAFRQQCSKATPLEPLSLLDIPD